MRLEAKRTCKAKGGGVVCVLWVDSDDVWYKRTDYQTKGKVWWAPRQQFEREIIAEDLW